MSWHVAVNHHGKRIKSSDLGCQNCQLVKMINITGGARNASQRSYQRFDITCTPLKLNAYRQCTFTMDAFTRKCVRNGLKIYFHLFLAFPNQGKLIKRIALQI